MAENSVKRALSDKRLDYYQAIRRHPETEEIIRCEWETVMSADQAARIRAARRTRATNGNNTKPNSLLSGLDLLKCGYCGRTVKTWCNGKRRKDGTKLKYYGCCAKNSRNACSKSRSLPQLVLDEGVLTNVFNSISCLEDLMCHWVTNHEGVDIDGQVKKLEAEERNIQQQIQRLVEAVATGALAIDDIAKQKSRLTAVLADIDQQRQSIESHKIDPPDWDSLLLTRDEFEHLDFIDRRRFLSLILDEIKVYGTLANLYYKFPISSSGNRKTRINLPGPRRGTAWGRNPRYKGA